MRELRFLADRLCESSRDVPRVAESRGGRLPAHGEGDGPDEPEDIPDEGPSPGSSGGVVADWRIAPIPGRGLHRVTEDGFALPLQISSGGQHRAIAELELNPGRGRTGARGLVLRARRTATARRCARMPSAGPLSGWPTAVLKTAACLTFPPPRHGAGGPRRPVPPLPRRSGRSRAPARCADGVGGRDGVCRSGQGWAVGSAVSRSTGGAWLWPRPVKRIATHAPAYSTATRSSSA